MNELDDRRYGTASMTERLDCSREYLRLEVKAGRLAPPMKTETGRNYWMASDLAAYLNRQKEARAARLRLGSAQEHAAA